MYYKKSPGLGMGGEVAFVCDRSVCEARTARPACLERGYFKKGWILLKDRLAGNPQNRDTSL